MKNETMHLEVPMKTNDALSSRTGLIPSLTPCHAYQDYGSLDSGRSALHFEKYCQKRMATSPQFGLWNLVLDMELNIFMFIRSFREGAS